MPDSPDTAIARYAAQVSLWALGVAWGSLVVAGSLLTLEIRRWFNEGVRLSMSVMVDAKFFGGTRKDDNTYLAITVTNRGNAPTTLTHMVLFDYPSWWAKRLPEVFLRWIKSQRPKTFIVNSQTNGHPLPHVLEPGRNWHGMAIHTPDLETMIDAGRLYVGVIGSHSNKTFFNRVRRWKAPKDTKEA